MEFFIATADNCLFKVYLTKSVNFGKSDSNQNFILESQKKTMGKYFRNTSIKYETQNMWISKKGFIRKMLIPYSNIYRATTRDGGVRPLVGREGGGHPGVGDPQPVVRGGPDQKGGSGGIGSRVPDGRVRPDQDGGQRDQEHGDPDQGEVGGGRESPKDVEQRRG